MKKKEKKTEEKEVNKLIKGGELHSHLIKSFLKKGKLSKIDFLMNKVYLSLLKETGKSPLEVTEKGIENIMPVFLLTSKKIGKTVLVKPFFILSKFYRQSLGFKWIVESASRKKGGLDKNLPLELLDAYRGKGFNKNRQLELYATVLENKSNIKYRW